VEGKEGLNLTCHLPVDQHGNPDDVYLYYWKYPYKQQWTLATLGSLIIEYNMINATEHDGEWQCKIGNVIGNSSTSKVLISVNGKYLHV